MNSTTPSQSDTSVSENDSGDRGAAAAVNQRVKATAREAIEQVKQAASSTLDRAKQETGRIFSEQQRTAADKIGGYSAAIHDSAKSLEEKDPNIAWFTHRAADRLQGVAAYVRDRNFTDLRRDAEIVARRYPVAFFGGLFVAGLLVGNLLKATGGASAGSRGNDSAGDDLSLREGKADNGGLLNQDDRGVDLGSDTTPSSSGIENRITT